MPGKDEQTQTQTQNSKTEPWGPAQQPLMDLIGKYSGLAGSGATDVTAGQTAGLNAINAAAGSAGALTPQAAAGVMRMFGTDTSPQIGMLSGGLDKLNTNLGATASGAELDPYATPGFSDAIKTMTNDITNQVKGVYNASGRAPSGAGSFAGSLGRGLTQSIAPIIASQFNTNKQNQMGAARSLFDANTGTVGGMLSAGQIPFQNIATGAGLLPGLISSYLSPAQAKFGAESAKVGLPFENLKNILGPLAGLGALGGQNTGSGTSVTTQPQSTLSNVIGGATAAASILALLSDERAKDDIEPIGKLHDGQDVVRFKYKGSDKTEIGLIAQDVARFEPTAVGFRGGLLHINPRRATDRAAAMAKAA